MIIIYILLFVWELPQNGLGFFVWIFVRSRIINKEKIRNRSINHVPSFGISLGSFVFWSGSENPYVLIKANNKQHELGHTIQSVIFGPLYLLLIGIPSIFRVLFSYIYFSKNKTQWQNYYNGYPEKWADTLGQKYFPSIG